MMATIKKLKEVHANLWGSHNPISQSNNIYLAILIYKYTYKSWTLYLKGKDDFVDVFQAWFLQVEIESKCFL